MSLYKYRRHLKLRTLYSALKLPLTGFLPLVSFSSQANPHVSFFSHQLMPPFSSAQPANISLQEPNIVFHRKRKCGKIQGILVLSGEKTSHLTPELMLCYINPGFQCSTPPHPRQRVYWKGREQTNRHHLFIMTTLKPRMELDITPVSTS